MLNINAENVSKKLIAMLEKKFQKAGFKKAIFGLSGGLDSAVAGCLAIEALGKENVIAVKMPYKTSSRSSIQDADIFIQRFGIKSYQIYITEVVDLLASFIPGEIDPLRLGNIMARIRMTTLFDLANKEEALVLGTSNRSEILLGYGTIFGDMASIINPIGMLFKTQIYELAKYLNIPQSIIDKKPSADLHEGQTDEADLGFSYQDADTILSLKFDDNKSILDISNYNFSEALINKVLGRVEKNRFKREIPIILDHNSMEMRGLANKLNNDMIEL